MAIENLGGALWLAANRQNLEIIKLVLDVFQDLIHSRNSALHQSCCQSDSTEVMELLSYSWLQGGLQGQSCLYHDDDDDDDEGMRLLKEEAQTHGEQLGAFLEKLHYD